MKNMPKTENHPAFDPLLSVAEAASYLGLHPETLKKMVRTRQIACVRQTRKKGSNIRFRLSTLNFWIKKHEVAPVRER